MGGAECGARRYKKKDWSNTGTHFRRALVQIQQILEATLRGTDACQFAWSGKPSRQVCDILTMLFFFTRREGHLKQAVHREAAPVSLGDFDCAMNSRSDLRGAKSRITMLTPSLERRRSGSHRTRKTSSLSLC